MKTIKNLFLISLLAFVFCCKKKEAEPDPYAFLQGTWRYDNGAECVFDAAEKKAKGTKVPTNDIYGFIVGEDYWRSVVSTGSEQWTYEQIVRRSDKVTVNYVKSTMAKKDANTLSMSTPGLSDSKLTKVIP